MMLRDVAKAILNDDIGATYQDKIEAYQFMNDNFLLDELSPYQQEEFRNMVELGIIATPPFRG
jgi:hypothetical protein